MRLGKVLIGCGVASILTIGVSLLSLKQAEAQSSRPYVVIVNGQGNCCSWGMEALAERLKSLYGITRNDFRYVPYSNFRDGGQSGGGNAYDWSSVDTQFLRNGADFINNQLDKNRPLVLIGHSYGGDSVLKLLPRINRRIQFVAVLDPVSTGGFRSSLSGVPSNVDYFFNRWQENEPFPNDFVRSGSLQCSARKCDQEKQQFATDENFNTIRDRCGTLEFCRTKNRRIGHQSLPTDAGVQRWLGDRISEALVTFKPVNSSSSLGFYRQQDRPEVYLVYRPGFYCHVQNENQMAAFGGFGKVQVVSSLNLNGTKTGGCGWPNGFFKLSNKPEVYRMYGGGIPEFNIGDSFCHVANEAQMNAYGGFGQVRGVSPSSDLGRGRRFTGKCPNP